MVYDAGNLRDLSHAPLFRGGEDYVCEPPLGNSSLVMNMHNPFKHCVTSQYAFKLGDVTMLLHAVIRRTVTTPRLFKWHVSPRFINAMEQITNLKNM